MIKFDDNVRIMEPRCTSDGYLVADVRCARTGCQSYLADEVGFGEGVVTIYRPDQAVFHKDSMATFAGKPVTVGHPPVQVTSDNWRQYAVGDIGEEIARDGEFIRVSIKVMDAAAIKAIEGGTREISMGYSTPVEVQDGVAPDGTKYQAVQTGPIVINHLAIVDRARGGERLRIGDDAENWGLRPTTSKQETHMSDALKTVVLGDKAVQVSAGDVALIDAFKAETAKTISDKDSAHKLEIDAKDKEIAIKDGEIEKLKAALLSDADLDARVEARATLLNAASMIAKDVKTDGLSDADIRKAVVGAKFGDAAIKDRSDAYVEARFDMLAEDAAKGDPLRKTLADRQTNNDGDADPASAAYAKNLADMASAWSTIEKVA